MIKGVIIHTMINDIETGKDNRIALVLTGVLMIIVLISLFFILRIKENTGRYVTVISEGREVYSARLEDVHDEEAISVVTEDGKHINIVHISSEGAWVTDSDCKGHDCVKIGKISHSGETIACLPNRLIVVIKSGNTENEENAIDAVTY